MATNSVYPEFLSFIKQTAALAQIGGLLSWDQETMMPVNGASARAEQVAALETVMHQRRTDPRLGEWLAQLDDEQLDQAASVNVERTRRTYERSQKIPSKLAEELARLTSSAQQHWARARENEKFEEFQPYLSQIVSLKREEAECLSDGASSLYDCLLDDFEPGMSVDRLQPLLEGLRPRLSALRERIAATSSEDPKIEGRFSVDDQMKLARLVADKLGYDWNSGRLDLSVHPFSSGTAGDARITTRIDEVDPVGCLYSTIHELGHALYEQGVPTDHALTPAGQHVSMGVHESQSRLWENQIGRSRAFCRWLYPHMVQAFGDFGIKDHDELYRAINRVETGHIRTEADEVHYNLHILLRFELERDMIAGRLEVSDLEQAWNDRFKRDFGKDVDKPSNGVLQDIHWSAGLFGYFPTYSLGNIYAAQLNDRLNESLGNIDEQVEAGEMGEVLTWLRSNIHNHGSLLDPEALIEQASGQPISSDPLLSYLEEKFTELYGL